MACFAIYRLICHSNPLKNIDKHGVRNGRLNNRFYPKDSNEEISIIDHRRLANDSQPCPADNPVIFQLDINLILSEHERAVVSERTPICLEEKSWNSCKMVTIILPFKSIINTNFR